MNTSSWWVISLCAVATAAVVLHVFGHPVEPEPAPVALMPTLVAEPASPAKTTNDGPVSGSMVPRVEFAARTAMGPGVSVVDGRGALVGESVLVAVPDGFGQLAYLPKGDPRAVRYDEQQRVEHAKIEIDNGPAQVKLGGAFTMRNSVSARRRVAPFVPRP